MPFTLTMPKLSPTMEEGTLVKWHKKVGDFVAVGDVVIEVATDKATVEHSALDEGWLKKIVVEEGQEAVVNQAIAIMTVDKDESIEGYQPEGVDVQALKQAKAAPQPVAAAATSLETAAAPVSAAPARGLSVPAITAEPPLEDYEYSKPAGAMGQRILASPLARKLAKERGLDLTTIKGSGPNNRIMSRDLEKAQPSGKVTFGRREIPKQPPGSFEL